MGSDNGLSVACADENHYGTILFGDFIHQNENVIVTISFKLETAKSGFCGFGFATEKFTEFTDSKSGFNYDADNNSRIIYYARGQVNNCWGGGKWKSSYFSEIESFDLKNSKGFDCGD